MEITDNTYYVTEIFESIQGEGNFSGVYCLFIRFHFCNLTCHWCDTKYTWDAKSGKNSIHSADSLKQIINESKAHHIIFTGGEPSLYRLDNLFVPNKKFHVETNGCYLPSEKVIFKLPDGTMVNRQAMESEIISRFNWVVSPKLSNSYQDFPHQNFGWWVQQLFCTFKFVITSESDLAEVDNICLQYSLDKFRVYIAIEGFTLNSQLQPELVEKIIDFGFNFSPRLHVMLWGAKRGK